MKGCPQFLIFIVALILKPLFVRGIDYGPQVVVPRTDDMILNVTRTIYRTVPLPSTCTKFINIAAQMTIPWWEVANTPGYAQQFAFQGTNAILGWWLWAETRNQQGGIDVGGVNHCINLTIISSGFTRETSIATAEKILNGTYGSFDLAFGPWSSGLNLDVAPVYHAKGFPILMGYATAPEIFRCAFPLDPVVQPFCNSSTVGKRPFPTVWGALPESKELYAPVFNILKLYGAKKFAFVASSDAFSLALMYGCEHYATAYGFTILYTSIVAVNVTEDQIVSEISKAKAYDPDVLLLSPRFRPACISFVKELKKQDYFPRALMLSQCVDASTTKEDFPDNLAAYSLDYISWHESVQGASYTDDETLLFQADSSATSSMNFYKTFYNRWGIYPDRISAPVAVVMGYIVEKALAFGGSINFQSAFPYIRYSNFWGQVAMNTFGFNSGKQFVTVQLDQNSNMNLVAPLDVSSALLIYPAPTWSERVFNPIWLGELRERVAVAFAIFGLMFSIMSGIWLIIYRQHSAVLAAQPPFLGLMLFGSCLLYSTMIVWTEVMTDALCVIKNWLLSLGFVVLYGTLVARVHRVSSAFSLKDFSSNAGVVDEKALFKIIVVVCGIDMLILAIWSAVNPHQMQIIVTDPLRASKSYTACIATTPDYIFVAILGVYKLAIVIYGLYLSVILWQHRHSIFIESRRVIFCFYNLAVFAALFSVLQVLLTTNWLSFVLRSACIFISAFATLAILIIPRMMSPDKQKHDVSGTSSSTMSAKFQQEEYEQLKKENTILRQQIADLKGQTNQVND